MNQIIPLKPVYDRSRVVQDWRCPRSRYWAYEHLGIGIAPGGTTLELFLGTALHDALAAIATLTKEGLEVDIDEIANAVREQVLQELMPEDGLGEVDFALEQAHLCEGLIRGFYRIVWPRLLAKYPRILHVEGEMKHEHDGLIFMSKPDLVMGNDEETVYVEYKSTASKKDSWVNSWNTAIQLHSTLRAIESTTGLKVDGVVVQGLYKGYESYGKQNSVFCYAYRRAGNPPFTKEELRYDYKAGFTRYGTWNLDGGLKRWVENMPEEVLGDQFPQTQTIYINDEMVDAFFAQRALREQQIAAFKREAGEEFDVSNLELDEVFPQRFDQCVPSFGKPCPFQLLCHGPKGIDPLDIGFRLREPHHALEAERFSEEE